MTIKEGDKLPEVTLHHMTENGPTPITLYLFQLEIVKMIDETHIRQKTHIISNNPIILTIPTLSAI